MGHIEQGDAFFAAINAQRWDVVASSLTDDFVWEAGDDAPLDKHGFIAVQQAWFAAAPDYRVSWRQEREEGDVVSGTASVSGTQTRPLAFPGQPAIPASGKRFAATLATTITWRGSQIAAATTGPSTPDLFAQLGFQPPA